MYLWVQECSTLVFTTITVMALVPAAGTHHEGYRVHLLVNAKWSASLPSPHSTDSRSGPYALSRDHRYNSQLIHYLINLYLKYLAIKGIVLVMRVQCCEKIVMCGEEYAQTYMVYSCIGLRG